jgi:hypothetical protein
VNASQHDPIHRAFWADNNNAVRGVGLTVLDTQEQPTGFIVGGDGKPNRHGVILDGVTAVIPHGKLVCQADPKVGSEIQCPQ